MKPLPANVKIRTPIGCATFGDGPASTVAVVCDDGSVFAWLPNLRGMTQEELLYAAAAHKQLPHHWQEFASPVPGTARDVELSE